MPADVLREPKPAPDPGSPPPPDKTDAGPDLPGWYRSQFEAIRGKFSEADTQARELLGKQKAEFGGMRQKFAEAPGPPKAPALPEGPAQRPIKYRPFLEGGPGQSWQASLQSIMFGFGLMAQMGVGLKGGFPGGALAAYQGALTGWQQGDEHRAAADWTNYLDEVQNNERASRRIRQQYDDKVKEWGHDQERLKTELTLLTAEQGLDSKLVDLARQDPERGLALLESQAHMWRQMKNDAANITMKNLMFLQREQAQEDLKQYRQETLEMKKKEAAGAAGPPGSVAGFKPEALELASRLYLQSGQLPPMGLGKTGTAARTAIINRASELAGEAPGGVEGQSMRQALYKANQTELNRIQAQRGVVLSFARTADKNLEVAERLSEQVDRTGTPVLNRWLLAGRRSVGGDAQVAAFDAAVRTAVNEFAKVTSSATGGGVTSDTARKEIEATLNTAHTPEQFRAIAVVLRTDMKNRVTGYEDQINETKRALGAKVEEAPKAAAGTAAKPPITVIGPNGQRGTVPADTDLAKYPGWKRG